MNAGMNVHVKGMIRFLFKTYRDGILYPKCATHRLPFP